MTYRESTHGSDDDVTPGRHTVESSVSFGSTTTNEIDLPTDGMHHVSGEVKIEVSGAGSDWPWPARVHRELEAAVADVLDDVAARVDVEGPDRGEGVATDGGVVPTEHAGTRWRQRADDPEACAVVDAWAAADPYHADGTLTADETRHHAPSGTVLVRIDDEIVTVLDEGMVGAGVEA